jgi:hypothetical protein
MGHHHRIGSKQVVTTDMFDVTMGVNDIFWYTKTKVRYKGFEGRGVIIVLRVDQQQSVRTSEYQRIVAIATLVSA